MSVVLRVREYRSPAEAAGDLASFRLPRLPLPALLHGTVVMAEGSEDELRDLAHRSRELDAKAYAGRHSGRDAVVLVLPHRGALDDPLPEDGSPLARCINDHFRERPAVVPTARGRLRIDRPLVMGILNVTPDSFSDGGRYVGEDAALARAERMVEEGVDIIDVGGESTRPGAVPVGEEEELARVVPVVERVASLGVPVSVDTMKPGVARAAVAAGAGIVNDVSGLRDGEMIAAVRDTGAAAVVMHMRGRPATMQAEVTASSYGDVVADVMWFLEGRLAAAEAAGVPRERIIVDPGLGFGKTPEHNLELLRRCRELRGLGRPVLVGASRKGFIGRLTGTDGPGRLGGSIAAAAVAVANGARVVRVHDVRETAQALRMLSAVSGYST